MYNQGVGSGLEKILKKISEGKKQEEEYIEL